MAFPSTITTDSTYLVPKASPFGPYLIGGVYWIILLDDSNVEVGTAPALFSSPDGITWTYVATASAPTAPASTYGNLCAGCVVGTLIYIFSWVASDVDIPYLFVQSFDTVAETFTALYETSELSDGNNIGGYPCVYRSIDNKIILGKCDQVTVPGQNRAQYFEYDITAETIGSFIACGVTDDSNPNDCDFISCGIQRGTNRTHFFFASVQNLDDTTPAVLYQQTLEDDDTLGVLTEIQAIADPQLDGADPFVNCNADSDGTTLVVQWPPFWEQDPGQPIYAFQGTSAAIITFAMQSLSPVSAGSYLNLQGIVRATSGQTLVIFMDGDSGDFSYQIDSGSGFGSPVLLGNLPTASFFHTLGLSGKALMYMTGSSFAWLFSFGGPPPVPPPPAYFTLTFKGMKVFGA